MLYIVYFKGYAKCIFIFIYLFIYLFQKWANIKWLLSAHKQTNKKIYPRGVTNMSFVQKEGSKIVFIDEAGESTVVVNDVIGESSKFWLRD